MELIKKFFNNKNKDKENSEKNKNKKIENLVFLIIVLIVVVLAMKNIWKNDNRKVQEKEKETDSVSVLAKENNQNELEKKLEKILSTIKNSGNVEVFINYSESSTNIPLYDETITTSDTEEGDSSGENRKTVQTETQKEVVFSEETGNKVPVTSKTTMPIIQGAIITADGANNASVKNNIITAVQAVTGLSVDKIQVFEKENFSEKNKF